MDASIKFGEQELYVKLLDTPIATLWAECVEKWNSQSIPMKTHNFMAHNVFPSSIYSEQQVVNNINSAIESANNCLTGKKVPYKAYLDMTWQQTNLIHRCFTTAEITSKTWKHNLGYEMMIQGKKESYLNKRTFLTRNTDPDFIVLDKDKFEQSLHEINKWVHHYEDLRISGRSKKLFENIISNQHENWHYSVLELDWDNYHGVDRDWIKINRASYGDVLNTFSTKNVDECDVFVCVTITGKDYETAYYNFDDPLEFDTTNLDIIHGGVRIYKKEYLEYLYGENGVIIKETSDLGIPPEMVKPIPLGKIQWSSVDFENIRFHDYSKMYTDSTPVAVEQFYRPTIEIKNKPSLI